MAKKERHPVDAFLDLHNFPTIWCPGCGIGIVVNTFIQTLNRMKIQKESVVVISSGISCVGKIGEHLNLKNIEAEDPFKGALEFREKNLESNLVVFFSDNDLMVSGVDNLINACRAGINTTSIYINSFIINLLFFHRKFTDFHFKKNGSNIEPKTVFNLPNLMKKYGASYIARWTPLHCRRLSFSIRESLSKAGFSFIEIISPCLMYYASSGYEGKVIDRMGDYLKNSKIENDYPIENLYTEDIKHIIIGKFLDKT